MPTPIVTKHSNTASSNPTTSDIIEGELALNTKDKTLWSRDDEDNIIQLTPIGGADHTHTASDITDLDSYILSQARPSVSTQTGTAYTIDADDEYSVVRFTNTGNVSVTVPANADDALPIGYTCHLHYEGTGTLTVVEGTGVTVNSSKSLLTAAQYSALSLIKVASDQWLLVGDQG